eukprot:gene39961-23251_t
MYVGLGLLSQGYSLAKGGWVAGFLIIASAGAFLWTGKLI